MKHLAEDYERTLSAGLLPDDGLTFDRLLETCRSIQDRINGGAKSAAHG